MGIEIKKARCVIIGSAPVDEAERRFIGTQVSPEDFLVCADGGYETARRLGLKPGLLIGDLDSCTEDFPPDIEAVRLPVHKDDTDMMYSLKECLGRGYRDFLLLGATGGRLDHTVANLCGLYYLAMHNARGVLADRQNETVLVINGRVGLQGEPGALVSVFPYGASYCTLSYEGLE
ncbi:MAG: thiamine diphosphokinase, partial [[Clostridium] leptum]